MTHWAWGWGGGQWRVGYSQPTGSTCKGQLDSRGTMPDTDPNKECAREAAWQQGCGQGSAWPANASGHRCSTSAVEDTSQHGQAAHRPTVAAGRTWGPLLAQGQGAASTTDVRRERSQLRPRDQGTGGPDSGAPTPSGPLWTSPRGCSTGLSTPPDGRPPYLLPPDTHGRPSIPLWSCLSPQGSGRAEPTAKACLLGSVWAWPAGHLRRGYGEPPPLLST